jgi:predicted nucleotidyltransferase
MVLTEQSRDVLKRALVESLAGEKEVRRIVVFGSFNTSAEPRDIDVAVFQDSAQSYLSLAMKCRRKTRAIARRIPVDVLPIAPDAPTDSAMMKEILAGVTLYEG